ncbi:hypothetical protein GCM10023081_20120 [Arthrobacter ginkgonis]|uniref:Helix-turn-helix domain-containing protein n=1 Tax=Arthrobacter ginkgonis TaxID=1630594 RepID=A0ABP7C762_9MICC
MSELKDWNTPAQIAEHFNISTSTVYANIHNGAWECTRFGERIYRFSRQQVEAIVNAGTDARKPRRNKARLREALRIIS